MLNIDLTNRRALVTGGARGIGAAIVRVLAECGAEVCFTHRGSPEGTAAAEALVAASPRVHRFVAAAEDPAQMEAVAASAAETMGGLDLLVPNVGVNEPFPIEALELDAWQRALDLNLTSAYLAVKCALPWLTQAERADIVLIGSSASEDGGGGSAAYAAAKAGLEGFMFALMRELPARGIHINTVRPCLVDTALLRTRYDTEEMRARLTEQVPLGRLSRPEDVAYLVAFLCSDLGAFICGQTLLVDGGRTLWRNR